ncbi:MAG: hypothetical protein ACRDG5_11070 [Anaerolineales bacterium]
MNLATIAAVTVILFAISAAISRLPPRPRRWVLLLLGLPGAIVLCRWAAYREAWPELVVSAAAALILRLIWWFLVGRRLPPPSEGDIRVWSKEDPF